MPDTGYVFQGVGHVEAQNRDNSVRTGVPGLGAGAVLAHATVKRTAAVEAHNVGEEAAHVRLRHQGATKTRTNEYLVALAAGGNRYVGKLGQKDIVPGTVSITNGGAPATIVDVDVAGDPTPNGELYDTGTATLRGTINRVTGVIDFTYGAAPTEPVRITYQHTDYTDFASPSQSTVTATGGVDPGVTPFVQTLGFGRVNPYSIAMADGGAQTYVDDGKGNIVETTGASADKVGTVDYARGIITLNETGTGALTGNMTTTYTFNPFAALLAKAGGAKLLDVFSQIPEFTAEAWADGIKGESRIGLWGESRSSTQTNLVTTWVHFGEEPYRVEAPFTGFPPGGESNDPNLIPGVAHL